MTDEVKIEMVGDNTKLDKKMTDSANKQVHLAKHSAKQLEDIYRAQNQEALEAFDRIGARAQGTADAVGRPMVKLKQEFNVFAGVALRTGGAVAAALVATATAARAVVNELEKARKLQAEMGKNAGDKTLDAATALARAGIDNVGAVVKSAQSTTGPANQDQINSFLTKLGESGLGMNGESASRLTSTYAKFQPILGNGDALLAAKKLFPMRNSESLADAAVTYRQRTGSDLSLSEINDKDRDIVGAEQQLAEAQAAVDEANTGGSLSGLESARDRAAKARDRLEQLRAQRSDFNSFAEPVSGAAARYTASLGTPALTAIAVREQQRKQEIKELEAGQGDAAIQAQVRAMQERAEEVNRSSDAMNGNAARAAFGSAVSALSPYLPGTSSTDRATDAGTAAVVEAIDRQTRVLLPQPEFRPGAHDESNGF